MVISYKYGILQLRSDDVRNEILNVGIVVEKEGGLVVHCPTKLDKIRAISAALNEDEVRSDIFSIPSMVDQFQLEQKLNEKTLEAISQFVGLNVGAFGRFECPNAGFYDGQVDWLMNTYVNPEPSAPKPVQKKPTKLRNSIKKALNEVKILARKSDGLDSHRVLTDHKLSEGVVVDFLLQNGKMHVVEAVDATNDMSSVRKFIFDIAMSAFTFEHARMQFGDNSIRPKLIYSASSNVEKSITSSLLAAEHQGAEIINWLSEDQKRAFVSEFIELAHPVDNGSNGNVLVHGSVQPYLKLN